MAATDAFRTPLCPRVDNTDDSITLKKPSKYSGFNRFRRVKRLVPPGTPYIHYNLLNICDLS